MSLVALHTNYGLPIIVSDLVITSEVVGDQRVVIPLINREYANEDFPGAVKPVSFHLKAIIVKEVLCVGFTGNVAEIKKLQSEIVDFFLHREVTLENLNEFHRAFDFNCLFSNSSAIFIFSYCHDGTPQFNVNRIGQWNHSDNRFVQNIYLSGTGKDEWNKWLSYFLNLLAGDKIYVSQALAKVLITCMYFTRLDMISPDNMIDRWGGGFDIIYFENGTFKKLDNTCYMLISVDTSEDEFTIRPDVVVNFSYLDDHLVIRHFNLNKNEYKSFGISASYNKAEVINWPSLIFSSHAVACYVTIYKNGEQSDSFLVSHIGLPTDEPTVKVVDMDGLLAVGLNQKLQKEISDAARIMTQ